MLGPYSPTSNIPGLVLEAASRLALPSMFMGSFYVERGGLASLRSKPARFGSSGGAPRRQDHQRHQAGDDPHRGQLEDRVRHQPQGRAGPRARHTARGPVPGRPDHPMTPPPGRLLRRTLVIAVVLVSGGLLTSGALELLLSLPRKRRGHRDPAGRDGARRGRQDSAVCRRHRADDARNGAGARYRGRRPDRGVPLRADQAPQDGPRHHRGGRRGQGRPRAPESLTDATDSPGRPDGSEPRPRLPRARAPGRASSAPCTSSASPSRT